MTSKRKETYCRTRWIEWHCPVCGKVLIKPGHLMSKARLAHLKSLECVPPDTRKGEP